MKLSVSAYRAHANAHKKILSSSYQTQLNYGSTAAASLATTKTSGFPANFSMEPIDALPTTHLPQMVQSPQVLTPGTGTASITSREEEDSQYSSDSKSPGQRTKSNQRWMKLRTTVQISSAMTPKKAPLKREDSFLKRFSTRQIPSTQETIEDTSSEGQGPDKVVHRRKRIAKPPRTVVNPDENFHFYWLMVLTMCVLYNFWTLIVRQSFPELQEKASTFWISFDALSDIIFILDIAVQLRTGYLEQGLMVYDGKKLAGHYLHSRAFLFDLASLVPLDLLQIRLGAQPLVRFPRFFKVYRAVKYYYIVESRTVYPNLWRVVNLIHILLILAHWFGCFYYLLSEAEGFQGDWVYPYRPGDYATLSRKYLGSLYWSTLTLTTIGDLPTPETNAEPSLSADGPRSLPKRGLKSRLLQFNSNQGYIFTIVSYLIGVFIFATIVGQVGNVITNRNANRLEFERLLDGAKTYMRHHKVPGGMKRRVLRWYDYSWSRGRIQGGGDINTALGLLPDKLKTELALHVNLSVLKKVTIFQECQPEFLHDLVLKMKAYIFTPGDSICRKGEVAREMFIIADGILEVLSETGKVLTTMKAGDFFGEIGILNLDGLNKRTADVRSVGYSELFSLSREDVLAAMKDYPEAQEILQTLGRKRLMEVRCVNKKHAAKKQEAIDALALLNARNNGDSSDNSASKRIVDKIKSDVKGLKNVLKKTRTLRRSDDSMEMQPLQCRTPKNLLRRMQRVKSDEMNTEEEEEKREDKMMHSPIGAGLPLLQRLRLLKEKQDREERAAKHNNAPPDFPVLSPPHSHARSAIAISPQESIQEEPEPEVIGAGLPMFQRLKLLKSKEDKAARENQSKLQVLSHDPASRKTSLSPTSPTLKTQSNQEQGISKTHLKVSFKDRIKSMQSDPKDSKSQRDDFNDQLLPIAQKPKKPSTTQSLRDKFKSIGNMQKDEPLKPWSKLKLATVVSLGGSYSSLNSAGINDSPKVSKRTKQRSTPADLNLPVKSSSSHKLQLDIEQKISVSDSEIKSSTDRLKKVKVKPRPLKLKTEPRTYCSVDDLSPEYCGLPFVKKLKILYERQKLAELESVIQTRSLSLDCTDSSNSNELVEVLTRSHSEASCVVARSKAPLTSPVAPVEPFYLTQPPPSPLSPDSTETLERKQLKSILKKLSEDRLLQRGGEVPEAEVKRLRRSQTMEGYVARHGKFLKCVTFNNTLSSPPTAPTALREGLFPDHAFFPKVPVAQQQQQSHDSIALSYAKYNVDLTNSTNRFKYPDKSNTSVVSPTENRQNSIYSQAPIIQNYDYSAKLEIVQEERSQKIIKGVMDEHEYYSEVLMGIKQVIQCHLKDLQGKFQDRFEDLELEVTQRDRLIVQLQNRICELEGTDRLSMTPINEMEHRSGSSGSSAEQPFMRGDSLDTIFASSPPSEHHSGSYRKPKSRKKLVSKHHKSSSTRIWDESSDQESFDFDNSPNMPHNKNMRVSNLTGNLLADSIRTSDSVVVNMESETMENSSSSNGEFEDDMEEDGNLNHNDWEVRMLAAELKRRESISEGQSDIDESDGLLRRRKKKSDTDTDVSDPEVEPRPRASSLDQHNLGQQYKCRGVFKAMSFDRDKDRL